MPERSRPSRQGRPRSSTVRSRGVAMASRRALLLVVGGLLATHAARAGDGCETRELVLPAQGTTTCTKASTADEANDYDPGTVPDVTSCVDAFGGAIGTPGRDEVWTLTLPPATLLDVEVIPTSGWDPAVYASTRVEPDSLETYCIDGRDVAFDGSPEVLVGLTNPSASEELVLYLVVDSASGSATFGSGPYTLELRTTPLTVGEGNDCGTPIAIDLVTATTASREANTCAAENIFDASLGCPTVPGSDLPGRDLVFAVTAPDSSTWSATVTPSAGWDVGVSVFTGPCTAPFGATCTALSDDGREGEAETVGPIVTPVGAGETVYTLVVDSRYAEGALGGCGTFEIAFTRTDVDQGTSEDCASPRVVGVTSGEVTRITGITCPFFNNYAVGTDDGCGENQLRAPLDADDQVYEVVVPADVSAWSVQLVPEGTYDAAMVVTRGTCTPDVTNCVAAVDVWGGGKPEGVFNVASAGGETFYVIVDAVAGCGGYELLLRGDPGTPVAPTTWSRLKSRYRVGEP